MKFPPNYQPYLDAYALKYHFPKLNEGVNFKFTSLGTDVYNCVAWASEITDDWTQEYDSNGNLLLDAISYIDYFKRIGFKITDNRSIEKNKIKIAVYISTHNIQHDFKHVARMLPNGKWTSKLGDWEDIEHDTPELLTGNSYGNKIIIMERII